MFRFINTFAAPDLPEVVPVDSTIVLAVLLLTVTFMLIGLLTKYKIYLMASVGGLITLMLEFREHTPIVIAIIGVIIFNLYHATIGSRDL